MKLWNDTTTLGKTTDEQKYNILSGRMGNSESLNRKSATSRSPNYNNYIQINNILGRKEKKEHKINIFSTWTKREYNGYPYGNLFI